MRQPVISFRIAVGGWRFADGERVAGGGDVVTCITYFTSFVIFVFSFRFNSSTLVSG